MGKKKSGKKNKDKVLNEKYNQKIIINETFDDLVRMSLNLKPITKKENDDTNEKAQ